MKIIKSIAAEWEALAIRLGFEGMIINTIRRGAFYQPDDACCKMFIRWLNGEEGLKPPTWYNLIQCLEETDKFPSLTRDIKETIQRGRKQYTSEGATKNRLVPKAPACSSPRGVWGHAPPENFEILCITRCFLRHSGD